MRPLASLVACALALGSTACSTSHGSSGTMTSSTSVGTGDEEPANMDGMVEAHNAARANVVPAASPAIPPLTWSSSVAAAAQAWAMECNFSHDTDNGTYGQNIYAATGDTLPPQVVAAWIAESANYDYATNTCAANEVCGHYTQVVWRDSTQLGCGVESCTTGSPFGGTGAWQIYVCNYAPPGNFDGEKPY